MCVLFLSRSYPHRFYLADELGDAGIRLLLFVHRLCNKHDLDSKRERGRTSGLSDHGF